MEASNQFNKGSSEINNADDDHSCLLSKMIYKQWDIEANMKFEKNFYELYQQRENTKYIHPDAPQHKLSDILRKKLQINYDNNNQEIEEEEEERSEDDLKEERSGEPYADKSHLLSERLIELCPQIFRRSY